MNYLVSIIVPIYCAEKYLNECIYSIINQTYKNIELILINDGSTDKSNDICQLWLSRDDRIKYICNCNRGVSYTRNSGLDIAAGDYITFCDADDIYSKDHIERLLINAIMTNADICISGYSTFRDGVLSIPQQSISEGFISLETLSQHVFLNNVIGGFVWNKLFKRNIVSEYRFDITMNICEDTYFLFEICTNNPKIYYCSNTTYNYRLTSTSAVGNVNNICNDEHRSKYTVVYEKLIEMYSDNQTIADNIKAGICMLAVHVMCDYKNIHGKDKLFVKNLKNDAIKYIPEMVKSNSLTIKKKAIIITNLLFNVRKLKRIKVKNYK